MRFIKQQRQGPAAARNSGIDAADGELIAFLDADDLWEPDKLALQVAYLSTHPDIGYVLTKQRLFIHPGSQRPRWLRNDLLHEEHTGFFPSTLLVRMSVIERVGKYDTFYTSGESADCSRAPRMPEFNTQSFLKCCCEREFMTTTSPTTKRSRGGMFFVR